MVAVEVEKVWKGYRLGELGSGALLRDALARLPRRRTVEREELWALRDISFTLDHGRALGVLGRNGAGKSTLLKLLTRITEPTRGVVRTTGRVASLLEVGTGFHMELTGRENVYLNGSVMGMDRRHVDGQFDAIVDFAGVERFLDTPVKRYSSGMRLRLAFAVAAHLEPEIFVVDEVLAVGDAEFQRKSLGRMQLAEEEGRTVIFVSHDLEALQRLCPRALWLDQGRLLGDGPTEKIVDDYLLSGRADNAVGELDVGGGPVRLRRVWSVDEDGRPVDVFRQGRPIRVRIEFDLAQPVGDLDLSVYVTNQHGVRVLDEAWSDIPHDRLEHADRHVVRVTLPAVLAVGTYRIGIWAGTSNGGDFFDEPSTGEFVIEGAYRRARAISADLDWNVSATAPEDVR